MFYFYKTNLMKFILKLLLTAVLVILLSYRLPGVSTDGFLTAVLVALHFHTQLYRETYSGHSYLTCDDPDTRYIPIIYQRFHYYDCRLAGKWF